jgi:peptide-methionine (S)-S-oxide reductase
MNQSRETEVAIFGGGCFWCTEAFFTELKGVKSIAPGYIGGEVVNPTYEAVCTGATGHAEAIKIEFYPDQISYEMLLEVFFTTHDPTTLNRQGNDKGTQYRSEIFYNNNQQKQLAEAYIEFLTKEKAFPDPIVTKVTEATVFYIAEDYHHNYYSGNKEQGYCSFVITPKLEKFKKIYHYILKE